ncbi:hypothetical protein, partial [Bradyrhizobium sp. CCBAU 11361]|uniref:hypothetical protein n=1 Tax=Bradyrhizobium sp. CCBAU 11361 TaxID=1630812 RepID=UPI002303BADD
VSIGLLPYKDPPPNSLIIIRCSLRVNLFQSVRSHVAEEFADRSRGEFVAAVGSVPKSEVRFALESEHRSGRMSIFRFGPGGGPKAATSAFENSVKTLWHRV